ncbi:MAG: hypothetical protein HFE77_03530 [Clostridiales bacterium]|nr:hypothetical protein [Clostridiales bacterium]
MDIRDLPQGFAMKLMQNEQALKKFEALSEMEQESIATQLKSFTSRKEMLQFANEFIG